MTFHQIKEFYRKNGKTYDHATAIHSLKSFEVHRKYSKFLNKWLDDIQHFLKDKTNIRKGLLINTLETFDDTQIKELYKAVNKIRDGKE